MLGNLLKSKVQIQEKTATQGALGQTVTWKPIGEYHARVISLDLRTISQYQQLNTEVSHKIIFRGSVDIDLGGHRIVHGDKTYQPQESARHFEDKTDVVVKEI